MYSCQTFPYSIVLGRFQNSSVPVLNLRKNSIPVSIGSREMPKLISGSGNFGSTFLTVLLFSLMYPNFCNGNNFC